MQFGRVTMEAVMVFEMRPVSGGAAQGVKIEPAKMLALMRTKRA